MACDLEYQQPDFYHFSEDSLKLASWASEFLAPKKMIRALELGAGCGVIGIELARYYQGPLEVTLCECQLGYREALLGNVERAQAILPQVKFEVLLQKWSELRPGKEFDLIICNPPYFKLDCGRPSSDERENIARRWSDEEERSFYDLLLKMASPQTLIILSLRNPPPDFFMAETKVVREVVIHERRNILTRGIIFALDIETNK